MKRSDERFEVDGAVYGFMFPAQGPGGLNSISPFPPKTVIGERSYSDYDSPSALAQASWAGGIGQEELEDATRFYDAYRVDGRAGPITLGPAVTSQDSRGYVGVSVAYAGGPFSVNAWRPIGTDTYTQVAGSFTLPTGADALYRVWLPLRATVDQGTINVYLYGDASGAPGLELTHVTLNPAVVDYRGGWVECVFDVPATGLTAGHQYWIGVEHDGLADDFFWYALGGSAFPNELVWTGAAWEPSGDDYRLNLWADDPKVGFDGPPGALVGIGSDNTNRVWAWHGRCFYQINADASPSVIASASGGPPRVLDADITDAVFFQASGASAPEIYLALGDSGSAMQRFDGDANSPTWATVTGIEAVKLAVHNGMLWRSNDYIEVSGSFDGAVWGTAALVGDRMHPIRAMTSWNGDLYVGTDTGIFAVTYPSGYPTTGTPIVTKVIPFPELSDKRNCSLFVVHHDDLFFNIGPGILRYTIGGVLQSVGADIAVEVDADSRAYPMAGLSTVSALWIAMEGGSGSPSYVLCYQEGAWQKIYTFGTAGILCRAIASDPGLYGSVPRLWINNGLRLSYMLMPMSTKRRWLWYGVDYPPPIGGDGASGWFDTSRFYGPLRTVVKSFRHIEIDCDNLGIGAYPKLEIYCRTDNSWVDCGQITESPYRLELPAGLSGYWIQLRVYLYSGTISGQPATPVLRALVLRYVERPDNVQGYTRTYLLSDRSDWRSGTLRSDSILQQLAALETLRQAISPLTWYPAWGGSKSVYLTDYSAVDQRFMSDEGGDQYDIRVTVRLQEA